MSLKKRKKRQALKFHQHYISMQRDILTENFTTSFAYYCLHKGIKKRTLIKTPQSKKLLNALAEFHLTNFAEAAKELWQMRKTSLAYLPKLRTHHRSSLITWFKPNEQNLFWWQPNYQVPFLLVSRRSLWSMRLRI